VKHDTTLAAHPAFGNAAALWRLVKYAMTVARLTRCPPASRGKRRPVSTCGMTVTGRTNAAACNLMVRPEGLEPPAYRFEACRSIQLSYGRKRPEKCSRSGPWDANEERSAVDRVTAPRVIATDTCNS
jgi:hypothetical protein